MTIAAMDWQRRLSDAEISEVARKRHERARRRELSDPLLRLNREIKERQDRRADERKLLELNPMNEPFWTLGMALAWVGTRNPLIVAKMWERWGVRNVNSEIRLTLLYTLSSADNGIADAVTSHSACEEIFDAARREKLVITAIRASGGRTQIPPDQWNDIGVPSESYDELPWKLGRIPANGPSIAGRFPLMRGADVITLWPSQEIAHENEQPSRTRPHQEAWQEVRQQGRAWLQSQVDAWRNDGGPQLSRAEVETKLRELLGLRSPAARDTWIDVAPVEWRVRGRRRSAGH